MIKLQETEEEKKFREKVYAEEAKREGMEPESTVDKPSVPVCNDPDCGGTEFTAVFDEDGKALGWYCDKCSLMHPIYHIPLNIARRDSIWCQGCGQEYGATTKETFCTHCGQDLQLKREGVSDDDKV